MECDPTAMYATIKTLCADSLGGRRAGSGNDLRAARLLADELHAAGCEPLWREALVPFCIPAGRRGMDKVLAGEWRDSSYNVVMTIRSRHPEAEKVLLGAHYDHLGLFKADKGKRHKAADMLRGANDNASGTAAVVEIARCLQPYADSFRRDLVVALFGAEEMGIVGSRHLERMLRDSAVVVGHMVNLEMLGRLKEDNFRMHLFVDDMDAMKQISVPNVDSLSVGVVMNNSGASDHLSFTAMGIPAALFTTDDMATLHQATDTPESLNMEGMERVVNYIMRNVHALLTAERLPSPNRTQEAQ